MENKFIILFFVFIFSSAFVVAQGLAVPHQFFGTATYNGAASEGIKVEAYYEGSVIKTAFAISGGFYNLKVPDPDDAKENEVISFYLNDVNTGQTAVFENGVSTKLDLVATGAASNPPSDGGSPSGGGGSPSGGSGRTTKTTSSTNNEDTETQETEILDEQKETKGQETTQEPQIQEKGFLSGITGAVTGTLGKAGTIGIVIFIIAIIIIAIYASVMKKKNSSKK